MDCLLLGAASAARSVLSSELPALPEVCPLRACAEAAASCLLAAAAEGASLTALEPGWEAALDAWVALADAFLLPLAVAWSLSVAGSTDCVLARVAVLCLLAGAEAGRLAAAEAFCCPDWRCVLADRAGAEGRALRLPAAERVVRPAAEGWAGLASSGGSDSPPVGTSAGQ